MDQRDENYHKYRGKCKEMSEALAKANPALRVVRGHYFDPEWGAEPHWWCVDKDGKVHDPTALQFPSEGRGEYVEFDGWLECEECGKSIHENETTFNGNHGYCSNECACRAVGL